MPLGRLSVRAVRCLSEVDIDLGLRDCYFYGPNGAGKSSLLESVHVLGRGRSFRTRDTGKLVGHGLSGLSVYGEAWREGTVHRLGVAFEGGRLQKRRDGVPAAGMAELAEWLPVFVVDPSSHQLVEGGPSERRRFLDWGVFHVEPMYLDAWRRYRRLLGQRNAALKRGAAEDEIKVWTESLADAGEAVGRFRDGYATQLAQRVADVGAALLGAPIRLEYRRGWPQGEPLGSALDAGLRQDRESGHTRAGPHRADLLIRGSAGGPVRDEASRGQQKLAAATLVLAQVALQSNRGGAQPVLLVDDPAAELDADALVRLRRALTESGGQLLMTSLSPTHLAPSGEARVFHVEQGRVQPVL